MPFKIIISIISSRYISFFHFRRIFRTLVWIHGSDPREGEKRTFLNISLIFHLFCGILIKIPPVGLFPAFFPAPYLGLDPWVTSIMWIILHTYSPFLKEYSLVLKEIPPATIIIFWPYSVTDQHETEAQHYTWEIGYSEFQTQTPIFPFFRLIIPFPNFSFSNIQFL